MKCGSDSLVFTRNGEEKDRQIDRETDRREQHRPPYKAYHLLPAKTIFSEKKYGMNGRGRVVMRSLGMMFP